VAQPRARKGRAVLRGEVVAHDDQVVVAQPDLAGDGPGRVGVVAGDHGHLDPRLAAGGQGGGGGHDAIRRASAASTRWARSVAELQPVDLRAVQPAMAPVSEIHGHQLG
jgi:hypothetical protein